VLAAVPAWWRAKASAAGLAGDWLEVDKVMAPPGFVDLDTNPDASVKVSWSPEQFGEAYVGALSSSTRSSHGRYYTPTSLAKPLWQRTREALGFPQRHQTLPGLVRDPACGAGALLLAPLREHLQASRHADPTMLLASVASRVHGIDNDPVAVWLTNVMLASELLPVLSQIPEHRRRDLPRFAEVGDAMTASLAPADVTIMNPPYGRVKLSDEERDRFDDYLHGHANLYGIFMGIGADSVNQTEGVLAALVPTSFLSGRYSSALRDTLSTSVRLKSIDFVDTRSGVFDGVLQETCLAVFTARRIRRTTVHVIGEGPTKIATVDTPRTDNPWPLPRRSDDAPAAAAALAMPNTLADVGWKVSTGPLVWNRRRDDLDEQPRGDTDAVPVIWAADLDGGQLHRDPSRAHHRYLHLTVDSDPDVMVHDTPAVLVQRTTAPEQARRLVTLELTQDDLDKWGGRVVVENHVNVLNPTCDNPTVDRTTLARLLASATIDRVFRCLAGSVAVSAYELEALPLPDDATLAEWSTISEHEDLERAVAAAYRPS
jgi:adenine-specific DNA-methyltransferase